MRANYTQLRRAEHGALYRTARVHYMALTHEEREVLCWRLWELSEGNTSALDATLRNLRNTLGGWEKLKQYAASVLEAGQAYNSGELENLYAPRGH